VTKKRAPASTFFAHLHHFPVQLVVRGAAVDSRAHQKPGGAGQFHPGHVPTGLQAADGRQQLQQLNVVDRPGFVMVPEAGVLATYRHHPAHPAGTRPEKIRLQGEAVAVAAVGLHDGIHPLGLEQHGAAERAHAHHRVAHLRHQKSIHRPFDLGCGAHHRRRVRPFGRLDLGEHHKGSRVQLAR
jgi:hypothetical protein